jgi:uncharacterized protein (DUF1800 family)
MELFTLGAGRGYTEDDVREQARALTGWRNDWKEGAGPVDFRFDRRGADRGMKTVFGKRGRFDWRDACRLCLRHPAHPVFFLAKLWTAFDPTEPDAATRTGLERLYRSNGFAVRPVVEAILRHPELYEGPRMVKPPAVYLAGMLRALGRPVDTESWTWLSGLAGQVLFRPPNVSGWDDSRWLDTSTFRGRWLVAGAAHAPYALDPERAARPRDPQRLVDDALGFWGNPTVSRPTREALVEFARTALADGREDWQRKVYPVLVANALRQLVAVSPDLQTA